MVGRLAGNSRLRVRRSTVDRMGPLDESTSRHRQPVAQVVSEILSRPRHRRRWEAWSRPGPQQRQPNTAGDGAQSSIAWVIDNHRYERVGDLWRVTDSKASSRSAVQRFFRQGARLRANTSGSEPIEQLTRSVVLTDIVRAFEFTDDEVGEIRTALGATPPDQRTNHMGESLHIWEIARSDEDLRNVVELSRRVIGGRAGFKPPTLEGPSHKDIAPLRERLDTRADAIELCLRHRVNEDSETVVGYCLAYPLNRSVSQAILSGEIIGAEQIDDSQVATSFAEEDSLYIGMVLGSDLPAKASVMERCIRRTTSWAAAHPDNYVFAKRSTVEGERWLESYGFVPVTDRSGIWMRAPSTPIARRRRRRLVATPT